MPDAIELVLIGGGHAHVEVLRRFVMRPLAGLNLTLISRDILTPYSGMLPGYVAGHYCYEECHIDLEPLARLAGARLHHAEVSGLDPQNRRVFVGGKPSVGYDLLAINTGSRPQADDVLGVMEHGLIAKPIDIFLDHWQELVQRVKVSSGIFHVVVVGGGAGGVELALATQFKLRKVLSSSSDDPSRVRHTLVTRGGQILPTHNAGVRRRFMRVLAERGIDVRSRHTVTKVAADAVYIHRETAVPADAVIWVTHASAPAWLASSGMALDEHGFIRVDRCLRSESHGDIFAAGDVASLRDPRPKSGVFAVRQGRVLASNLRRAAAGTALRRYSPQKRFLGLISTGNKYAVASHGGWSMEGAWLWHFKDRIDRRFMNKYKNPPSVHL